MRYMSFIKMAETNGMPPQSLMDAVGEEVGRGFAEGWLLDGGGLMGLPQSTELSVRSGAVTRVDGPYTEAKEIAGGYSVVEAGTHEEAVAISQRMVDLHLEHWPEVDFSIEIRAIMDA